MDPKQPKKMLIINILEILKKYTDENHRLSQAEIVEKLKTEYNMEVDRKSIRPNILSLINFGYDIEYSEIERNKSTMLSDFYLNREFTDEELRLVIDGLLFSKYLPYNQCKRLIEKIEALSSIHFKPKVKHIQGLPEALPKNNQLFYNIGVLDDAIEAGKQVIFAYRAYGTDKKLAKLKTATHKDKRYIVSPYQMVVTNGRYYLICNHCGFNNISYFRIDRITDIKQLDKAAKPVRELDDCKNGFNLPKHMAEHIYMFSGDSETVVFRADKSMVTQIIDWFGMDVEFFDETENRVTVSVEVNLRAMHYWALQYVNYIQVLRPESLVNEIKRDLAAAIDKYN